jgi:hypothetical protein
VVVLCRFGGSRAGKTLAFSRPSRTDTWCECLLFGAPPVGLLSLLACSIPIYLVVYYLCRIQMPRSSSCPSPATNRYVRLFPSPPTLETLEVGEARDVEDLFADYGFHTFIKNIMRRVETTNKKS